MLQNQLNICSIKQNTNTPFSNISHLLLAWTDSSEDTVTDDSQVIFNQHLDRLVYFQQDRNTIDAHLLVRLDYLLAKSVKKMSGRPELGELIRILKSYLFYLVNRLNSLLPIGTITVLEEGSNLLKFSRKLGHLWWLTFGRRSLSPLYLLNSFLFLLP